MRVLFLSQLVPWPAPLIGGQLRTARLVEALSAECAVSLLCTESSYHRAGVSDWPCAASLESVVVVPADVALDPLWGDGATMLRNLLPTQVPATINARVSKTLIERLAEIPGSFDAIWAGRSWTAEAARQARREPIIVDVDDFESILLRQNIERMGQYRRRPLHELEAQRLAKYERRLPRRFAGVAVTKEEDFSLLDARYRQQSFLVPNGVDIPAEVKRTPIPGRHLFVGSFGHPPNVEGMTWFCSEVLPIIRRSRADATVDIAGRGPITTEWDQIRAVPGVTLIESPPELTDLYARAAVVITPIRIGHGTKLKTLEALAYGVPLVATTEAASGVPIVPGKHYLSADTPEAFASQCVLALDDSTDLSGMTREASVVVERFTWKRVGQQAMNAIRQVAER